MKRFVLFAIVTIVLILLFAPALMSQHQATHRSVRHFPAVVTAYSAHRAPTASGQRVFRGLVACPRRYPLGTRVRIDGRTYKCEDRLSLKYDNRFDIWTPSRRAALAFGKHRMQVTVLYPAVVNTDNVG
jgi:3D (Asp-Asp-Asp) domain-containing protein